MRDARGMKAIASYYIKTLFLWKVEKHDKKYWQKKLSVIFREMVDDLYTAIKNKNIPYFWNEHNNLIQGVKATLLNDYADKLKKVLDSIDANDVEKVVYALLSTEEIKQFKESEFYKKQVELSNNISRSTSTVSSSSSEVDSSKPVEKKQKDDSLLELVKSLVAKVDKLTIQMEKQDDRILQLEKELKDVKKDALNPNTEKEILYTKDISESDIVDNKNIETEVTDLLIFS